MTTPMKTVRGWVAVAALSLWACDQDPDAAEPDAGGAVPACGEGERYHLGAGPYEPAVWSGLPVDSEPSFTYAADARFVGLDDGVTQWEPAGPAFRMAEGVLTPGATYSIVQAYDFGDESPHWTTSVSFPEGGLVFAGASGSLDHIRTAMDAVGIAITWTPECAYDGPAGCFTPNLHFGVQAGPAQDLQALATARQPVTWQIGSHRYAVVLEGAVEAQGDNRPCSGVPTSRGWLTLTALP